MTRLGGELPPDGPRADTPGDTASRSDHAGGAYSRWRRRLDNYLCVLSDCGLALALNAFIALILLLPEQSREAFQVVAEDAHFSLHRMILMWIFAAALGLLSWWSSRLTLASLHPTARWWHGSAGWLARNLPRLAGCLPWFILAVAICRTQTNDGQSVRFAYSIIVLVPILLWLAVRHWPRAQRAYRPVAVVGALVVVVLAVWLFLRDSSGLTTTFGLCIFSMPAFYIWAEHRTQDRKRGVPEPSLSGPALWLAVAIPFAVAILTVALFSFFPHLPSYLGPGSIVFGAGAAWLPLLAVLHWLSLRYRLPIVLAFLIIALGLSWVDCNDNHRVRSLPAPAAGSAPVPTDFAAAFKAWIETRRNADGSPVPVILVAAEGGGIYAAYYTAQALAVLQDANPEFADHVFAISGVSGGSVGAAVFCALVDRAPQNPPKDWFGSTADKVLADDLLSPVLASALMEDLVQRFLPVPIRPWDRARSLEHSLERAWQLGTNEQGQPPSETFARPFADLWTRRPQGVPSLVLNTTEVETGERVVLSNLDLSPALFPHLRTLHHDDPQIIPPLSTAAFLSARFPIVTPAAWIRTEATDTLPAKRRLVDGGYFENTGIATMLDMHDAIKEIYRQDRRRGADQPRLPPYRVILVRIGAIDSHVAPPFQGFGEALSPVRAMLHARTARTQNSIRQFLRLTDEFGATRESGPRARPERLQFVLDTHKEHAIPLGWLLSDRARNEIRDQLPKPEEVPLIVPAPPPADAESTIQTMQALPAKQAIQENKESAAKIRGLLQKPR